MITSHPAILGEQATIDHFIKRAFTKPEGLPTRTRDTTHYEHPIVWVIPNTIREKHPSLTPASFFLLEEPHMTYYYPGRDTFLAEFSAAHKYSLIKEQGATHQKYINESDAHKGWVRTGYLFTHPNITLLFGF